MTEREKLIEELELKFCQYNHFPDPKLEDIADFIIADRKRLANPPAKGEE